MKVSKVSIARGLGAALMAGVALPASAETVTMWTFLDPAKDSPRDVALRQIIEEFEAENPDIDIRVESQVWFTMPEKFVMAHRASAAPDIGWINGENMGLLRNSRTYADLKPLVTDGWSDDQWNDVVLPKSFEWLTADDGALVALPIMTISTVLYYRKDLLAEAGIDPATVKTWDDFAAAAKAIQVEASGQVERWGVGLHLSTESAIFPIMAVALVSEQDGVLFDDKCNAVLANEHGVRALQMQADLIGEHHVASPESFAYTLDDVIEQFNAGKVGFVSGGNARFGNIMQAAQWDGAQLGILPWPTFGGDAQGPQYMSGWFAAISKDSPRKEAAAKFLDFMVGPRGAKHWALVGQQVPLYNSVFTAPEFEQPEYAWMRELAGMWEAAETWLPADCNAARTFVDLNLATQRVVLGGVNPLEALKEAEASTESRQ